MGGLQQDDIHEPKAFVNEAPYISNTVIELATKRRLSEAKTRFISLSYCDSLIIETNKTFLILL